MSTSLITKPIDAQAIEEVLIKGDLSKLTESQRLSYYRNLCESVGLNPLSQPFQYITLSGKLTLYAKKDCTDQLRAIHSVSVEKLERETTEGIFTVTAHVRNGNGRMDAALGAVAIEGLKGEAKANAMMKAETKAKRRATLSICGLGMLDETEVDSIPNAVPMAGDPVREDAQNIQRGAVANGQLLAWVKHEVDAMGRVETLEGLSEIYKAAFGEARRIGSEEAKHIIIAAKDKRKKELEAVGAHQAMSVLTATEGPQ